MAAKSSSNLYQLKVTLLGAKPPIWRRLLVPAEMRLGTLHDVIQIAMGWENAHLHQFVSGNTFYGVQEGGFLADEVEDENRYKISDLLSAEKQKCRYEYDFGDSWDHEILLEKILPPETSGQLPRCLKGARACPPEDCGGIWGYVGLLEALSDPKHPEHQEMLEWLGGPLDAEAFDLKAVNFTLASMKA